MENLNVLSPAGRKYYQDLRGDGAQVCVESDVDSEDDASDDEFWVGTDVWMSQEKQAQLNNLQPSGRKKII